MFFFVSSKQKIGILTNFCSVCYFWKERMQNDVMMGSMKNKEEEEEKRKDILTVELLKGMDINQKVWVRSSSGSRAQLGC